MADQAKRTIVWHDLTVPNAGQIQDFYCQVVGWASTPHDMGSYHDYNVLSSEGGEVVGGICHARGENANIPPQWMIYITVDDVETSVNRCLELGGSIVDGPRMIGRQKFCIIKDPAGAVAALIEE